MIGRTINIREARVADARELAGLRSLLWPQESFEEQLREVQAFLAGQTPGSLPCTTFVAEQGDGILSGFIEVDLRSHADGCDPNQPVGYIEGWYVREEYRQLGLGKGLVQAAEDWARAHGCKEMASDALIDSEISQRAHDALGYEVVDRCVHFRKNLEGNHPRKSPDLNQS